MLMKLPLLITMAVFLILYLKSKGKYSEIIEILDKKEYPLKDFLPIGLLVESKLKYKFTQNYYNRMSTRVHQLYSNSQGSLCMKIYIANKFVYCLVSMLITTMMLASTDEFDATLLAFAIGLPVLIFIVMDSDLNKKINNRNKLIRYEFPDFLNKMILLINAGMTVNGAWEKIVLDNKTNSPLYDELGLAYRETKANKPQDQVYQDFARRCKVQEITKFVSVIMQNMKRGNSELVMMLRLQANECWEMRKSIAKQLGEEASTKLLVPMIIMLIAIFMIVLVPAVLQMNSFN